jgi:hypothetical protein
MVDELRRYKEDHGDCNVPQKWRQNPKLGTWVSQQRMLGRRGKLSTDRKARLDAWVRLGSKDKIKELSD